MFISQLEWKSMSKKSVRTRVNVTLTQIYVDGLNHLVDEGLYLNRGEIFLTALRVLFRRHGLEQFKIESVDETVETKE